MGIPSIALWSFQFSTGIHLIRWEKLERVLFDLQWTKGRP